MSSLGFPTDDVPNQGWKLYITSLTMILVAGLVVIARILTRYKLQTLGWDDFAIVLSLCFSIILSVAIQTAVVEGYGQHIYDLDETHKISALKWFFIAQTPYKVTTSLNKISLILLYMRIFVSKSFKISAWIAMAIVISYSIGSIFATIFQCIPVAGSYNKAVEASCIDSDAFWVAYASLNVATDVLVLSLPIPPIIGLHLRAREKIMLCMVFLLGFFVTVISILRVTAVRNSLANRSDMTWNFITRGIWTLCEANLGIIGACLPIFKQPLSMLFPKIFRSRTRSNSKSPTGNRYADRWTSNDVNDATRSHREDKTAFNFELSGRGDEHSTTHVPAANGRWEHAPHQQYRKSDEMYIICKSSQEGRSDSGSEYYGV